MEAADRPRPLTVERGRLPSEGGSEGTASELWDKFRLEPLTDMVCRQADRERGRVTDKLPQLNSYNYIAAKTTCK